MSIFAPVTFKWKGRDVTIPAPKIMGAIHVVEQVVTLKELAEMNLTGKPKLSVIAAAYAALIRYSSHDLSSVDTETVYETLFSIGGQEEAQIALQALLLMMVPKSVTSSNKADAPKGNAETVAST